MNEILSAVLIYIGAVILAILGLLLVRRSVALSTLESHNEVAGFVYAVLGVIYGVLLAFVVLVVWEQYNKANERVENEAATLVVVNNDSKCFTDSVQKQAKLLTIAYCESMINDEFPAMANNSYSEKTSNAYNSLWELYYNYTPKNEKETRWYQEVLYRMNDLGVNRRSRIMSVDSGIPTFMWYIIVFGAFITIGYSYLFYTKKFMSQAVIVVLLTTTIVTTLILVSALDHPYGGIIRVHDSPFREILHMLK